MFVADVSWNVAQIVKKMQSNATTVKGYIDALPDDRKKSITEIRQLILKNLPKGFSEVMDGMIGYVVPHTTYPSGYHCDPKQPLPFIGLASQKNYIALYHMGLYADKKLLSWFIQEYPRHSKTKLDMGKCCLRFKKPDQIPYKLIGELASRTTVKQWIETYEKEMKK